jgi:hypothetical protein
LAAEALLRRRGGEQALRWLAERVAGWATYPLSSACKSSDVRMLRG